tara:strand:- start:886 stop:1425 length:540 start_codon:yes stop_codon:yes gene_type:complete
MDTEDILGVDELSGKRTEAAPKKRRVKRTTKKKAGTKDVPDIDEFEKPTPKVIGTEKRDVVVVALPETDIKEILLCLKDTHMLLNDLVNEFHQFMEMQKETNLNYIKAAPAEVDKMFEDLGKEVQILEELETKEEIELPEPEKVEESPEPEKLEPQPIISQPAANSISKTFRKLKGLRG